METIQFTYGNFRYLVFRINGDYYLLDRRPNNLFVYFAMPLNCFFYQRVYPISENDYLNINRRNNKFKHILFPVSLGSGLSVFIGSWSRKVGLSFVTNFSKEASILFLIVMLVLSYVTAQLIFCSRKKSISKLVQDGLSQPIYYKIKPIKFDFKRIAGYIIIMLMLPICIAAIYVYTNDLLFLFSFYILSLISLLCVNLGFSAENDYFYKIVNIKDRLY